MPIVRVMANRDQPIREIDPRCRCVGRKILIYLDFRFDYWLWDSADLLGFARSLGLVSVVVLVVLYCLNILVLWHGCHRELSGIRRHLNNTNINSPIKRADILNGRNRRVKD